MAQDSFIHETTRANINTPQGENATLFANSAVARAADDPAARIQIKHSDGTFEPVPGGGGGVPYDSYVALITQAAGAAPVATVLQNELSGPIAWTRTAQGNYTGTLAGAFTANKTFIVWPAFNINSSQQDEHFIWRDNANEIKWNSETGGLSDDGIITEHSIEIRVYP